MAGIRNDIELGFRPGAVKVPRARNWTNNVIAALHNYRRNVTNLVHILNQVIISFKEAVVHEIVAFNPRQGQRKVCLAGVID